MHGAAAAIGLWPDLLDAGNQTRRAVADDQPRAAQASPRDIAAQVEPILARFTLPEANG